MTDDIWGAPQEAQPPATVYPNLEAWVREFLAETVRRRIGGTSAWCAHWFRHAEAIARLNAMWQEWERAAAEDAMSNWWLYHCDPHLNVLMSKNFGPFMACKPEEHRELEPLPLAESDPALWLGTAFANPT